MPLIPWVVAGALCYTLVIQARDLYRVKKFRMTIEEYSERWDLD